MILLCYHSLNRTLFYILQDPVLKIYNKIDKLEKSELEKIKETEKDALYISAKKSENIELLKEKIMAMLWKE